MPARKRARKPLADADRCTAKTGAGRRCTKARAKGLEVCGQHAEGAARGGRPTALTDEVADKVISALKLGGFAETAAVAAGVARSTIFAWLDRGDPEGDAPEDAPYRAFRERVDVARAEAEQEAVAQVLKHGRTDWRAAAWYLERSNPEKWAGPRSRSQAASAGGSPQTGMPPSGPPQLTVVNDQVGADGRAL